MNIPRLEVGEIYYVESTIRNKEFFYLLGMCVGGEHPDSPSDTNNIRCLASFISSESSEIRANRSWCYCSMDGSRIFRKASPSEVRWYNTCMQAGQWVKKPISYLEWFLNLKKWKKDR